MRLYKITDGADYSHGNTRWGEGVEYTAPGLGNLCTDAYLHAYTDQYLAVLMTPVHLSYCRLHLWDADGDAEKCDGIVIGCTRLKTIQRMDIPEVTMEHRIIFAISCVKQVYTDRDWNMWADGWLNFVELARKACGGYHV